MDGKIDHQILTRSLLSAILLLLTDRMRLIHVINNFIVALLLGLGWSVGRLVDIARWRLTIGVVVALGGRHFHAIP